MFKWSFPLEQHLTTSRLPYKINQYLNIWSSNKSRCGLKSRSYIASSSSTWSEERRGRGRLVMMREEACLTDASCPYQTSPSHLSCSRFSKYFLSTDRVFSAYLWLKLWHDNAFSLKMLSQRNVNFEVIFWHFIHIYRTRVRSLGMLVSNSLTHWLTHSLTHSCLVNLMASLTHSLRNV